MLTRPGLSGPDSGTGLYGGLFSTRDKNVLMIVKLSAEIS